MRVNENPDEKIQQSRPEKEFLKESEEIPMRNYEKDIQFARIVVN